MYLQHVSPFRQNRCVGQAAVLAVVVSIVIVPAMFAAQPGNKGRVGLGEHRLLEGGIERAIDSMLAIMTVREKVGQLNQMNSVAWDSSSPPHVGQRTRQMLREGRVGSFLNVLGADATRELQRIAVEESRLKIPLIFGFDVIHGFRTIFPIPLAEACTWDPDAVETSARVAAIEASAAGVHWTFAPMVDIARDPRWGRIAEGSGEDPYLGSLMAAARVRGFQGKELQDPDAIAACAKHFAAYGGAEGGRDYNTVDFSERTFREVYLPPFKAALDAGCATFMTSFNEINGIPSSANRALLTDILRGEWGFDGFVVSDWDAIGELRAHGVARTQEEAATLALLAGTDMDMEGGSYQNCLQDLVERGLVAEARIDTAVRRVLRVKYQLGLFKDPYKDCDHERERVALLSAAHLEAARTAARKSIVLLKNANNLLPLRKDLKAIAVIGPLADDQRDLLGPWSGNGRSADAVTVLAGIRGAVSKTTQILYARGCEVNGNSTAGFGDAVSIARRADAAVLLVGESADMSGEAASRSSLDLPGKQEALVEAIHATGTPVVVVLMNGRPLSITWIADNIQAILESWFLGTQAGNAIADVLFGEYNPSGKLVATFPRTVGQVPVYYNHKNTGRPPDPNNHYTSKYIDLPISPLFPFGFGLSYTRFTYSNLETDSRELTLRDTVVVKVDVTNTGTRSGDEVVQLYIRDDFGSVTRPVKELKAFKRISLSPGQMREVVFRLPTDRLAFYDQSMRRVVEPGTFTVMIDTLRSGFTIGRTN